MQRPDMAILDVARSVDLIILGSTVEGKPGGGAIDVGSILLGAGRPVLVAAHAARKLEATKVVVAWKDTKEARRAIADALPFLVTAEEVLVAVVDEGDLAEERDSMEEIVAWLGTHGVTARGDVLPNRSGLSGAILQAAISEGADLIVSGAYGHSKFRQWLLGGMTKDILGAQGINRLLSN